MNYEPVTLDQAEVFESQRAARAVMRLRRLRAWPRASLLERFLWWREQRKVEADVRAIARGLERRAWERDAAERADHPECAVLADMNDGDVVRAFHRATERGDVASASAFLDEAKRRGVLV